MMQAPHGPVDPSFTFRVWIEGKMAATTATVMAPWHWHAREHWIGEMIRTRPELEIGPDTVVLSELVTLKDEKPSIESSMARDHLSWAEGCCRVLSPQAATPRLEYLDLTEIANRLDMVINVRWALARAADGEVSFHLRPVLPNMERLDARLATLTAHCLRNAVMRRIEIGRAGVLTFGTGENAWAKYYRPYELDEIFDSQSAGKQGFLNLMASAWHKGEVIE